MTTKDFFDSPENEGEGEYIPREDESRFPYDSFDECDEVSSNLNIHVQFIAPLGPHNLICP